MDSLSQNSKALSRFVVCLSLVLGGTSTNAAVEGCPDGMVSYWHLDETSGVLAEDSIGANDGMLLVDPPFPDWTSGKIGGALHIADNSSRNSGVNIPDADSLDFTTQMTLEAWIYPTDGSSGNILVKWGPFATGEPDPRNYVLNYVGGKVGVELNGHSVRVRGSTALELNEWHHVAGVYDGSNLLIYLNGQEDGRTPFSGQIWVGERPLRIGLDGFDNFPFIGKLDEVAVYNLALSAEEIEQHYEYGLLGLGYCESLPTAVSIDIKPGSDPNSINPRSKGNIPVAILSTNTADGDALDFDALQVDPLSVEFGPDGATESHGRGHVSDVDGDGDADMVLHFRTRQTGIQCDDTKASLEGKTFGGDAITGQDSVRTVGCKKKRK